MADEIDTPPGVDGPPLETLGDVRREMARVYRGMKCERIPLGMGNGLIHALNCLGALLIDHRDSLHKRRLAVLWKEREQRRPDERQTQ